MKKQNKKHIICLAVSFIATVMCVIGATGVAKGNTTVQAEVAHETAAETKNTYLVGDTFTVPDGEIVYEGITYAAEQAYVTLPDGRISTDKNYYLSQAGVYTVHYIAEENGTTYTAQETFFVEDNYYETSSNLSSVTYVESLEKNSAVGGLSLTLKEGDSFRLHKPIDLRNASEQAFVQFYPYSQGGTGEELEAHKITITLTDCYNANNAVQLVIEYCNTGNTNPEKLYKAYLRAYSAGQTPLGLEAKATGTIASPRREIYINGKRYFSRYDELYGAPTSAFNSNACGFTFSYDINENQASCFDGNTILINDLDSEIIYDDVLFGGFTTGEVYLSISASDYVTEDVHIDIVSLGGIKDEQLKAKTILDDKAPEIKIDYTFEGEICIAKDEPFTLFNATATDWNLSGEVKRLVYYNYGLANQTQIGHNDGIFTPNRTGVYHVVYIAKDKAGNVATASVRLRCVEAEGNVGISFTVDKLSDCLAGTINLLPQHSAQGLNGDVNVEITAKNNEETVVIDPTTREFLPKYLGEYTIIYRYYDALKTYEYSYNVEAKSSPSVLPNGSIAVPEYFVENMRYSFEEITAYVYATGEREEKGTVWQANEDGEGYKEIDPASYIVKAEQHVQFKVLYGEQTLLESAQIPVISVYEEGNYALENMFAGDYTAEKTTDMITYKSNISVGNNTLKYVNPLLLSAFSIKYQIPEELQRFGGMKISLLDYYDHGNVLDILYQFENGYYILSVGNKSQTIYKSIANALQAITYDIDSDSFIIDCDGTSTSMLNLTRFTTNKILLNITLQDLNGQGGISIKTLCNQTFADGVQGDYTQPLIAIKSSAGDYALNTTVTIHKIEAADVLSSVLPSKMTVVVRDANNQFVTSVDGVVLDGTVTANRDYQIVLSAYGRYSVRYVVIDEKNMDTPTAYFMSVVDYSAPSITLEKGYAPNSILQVKQGESVAIAKYTVADDFDAESDVITYVVLIDPLNATHIFTGDAFTAKYKGTYTVCYYAYDASGNYSMTCYSVQVK